MELQKQHVASEERKNKKSTKFAWLMRVPTKTIINTLEAISILVDRPIPTKNIYGIDKSFAFKVKRAEQLAELIGLLKYEVGIVDEDSTWVGAGNTIAEIYGIGEEIDRRQVAEIEAHTR